MSRILHIDTAEPKAAVCIIEEGVTLAFLESDNQKEHAAFVHLAISRLLKDLNIQLGSIEAISTCIGPGSYTGLRVSLSAAKGLCFALNKPLISLNTLELIALSMTENTALPRLGDMLFCPMIDARRMEVFTALYSRSLEPILEPCAKILDADSFGEQLVTHPIAFGGSGSHKFKDIVTHRNACFIPETPRIRAAATLANTYFTKRLFASISGSVPLYLKPYQTG